MRPDYPAAHSMDTVWFAVDGFGHVAAFGSGEAGAVPIKGYTEEWPDTVEELKKLPRTGSAPRPKPEDPEDTDLDETEEVVAQHGIYYYSHEKTENILAGPYTRTQPEKPVMLDQLPPDLRPLVSRVRFDSINFASTPELQPVDYVACQAWDGAYLAADGVTVKAIPGMEKEYAESYQQFSNDIPEYTWTPPRRTARSKRIVHATPKGRLILLIVSVALLVSIFIVLLMTSP